MIRRLLRVMRWTGKRLLLLLLLLAVGFAALWLLVPLPEDLLVQKEPSPAVYDREGRPLLVLAAPDGQWRLPVTLADTGRWLASATVAVEDARFCTHPGVDPVALLRAIGQNVGSGRVVSGASTITMQLCRLLEPRPRTFPAKVTEAVRALKIERVLDKDGILERYLNLAPYGGNVVGAEAAARIWFAKRAADLSLPEAALLAGLPQSPTRYRPDLHPDRARARRSEVLRRMLEEGMIDEAAFREADEAPVRVRSLALAGFDLSDSFGRHAAWWALARSPRGGRTTLDLDLQRAVELAARAHAATLPPGSDVSVVVIDIESAEIRAMVGSAEFRDPVDGQVNGALALRSPGSALKPFLYATAFGTNRLAPSTPVPDTSMDRAGWRPQNFQPGFAGELPAAECLRRSLNIPAMRVAEAAGLSRCAGSLRAAGVPLPDDAVARGGLAIATGAVEVRLLDLTNAYATIGRGGLHRPAILFPEEAAPERRALGARDCAEIDQILSCRARTPAGFEDRLPEDLGWFMWKTGTSSGRRDALAVGHNRRFAIGVWAGRFSGQGHVEFTGASAAEPLLARLFQQPGIRRDAAPAPPPERVARRPYFARPARIPPRITTPSPDAVFLAIGGKATVRPESNLEGAGTWFLDGLPLPSGEPPRLELAPGRYELRLAGPDGAAAAVAFTVKRL